LEGLKRAEKIARKRSSDEAFRESQREGPGARLTLEQDGIEILDDGGERKRGRTSEDGGGRGEEEVIVLDD